MEYKVPKKEPVSRIGFECSSRFKFKPGMSVFLCQSEICCFVRCSECWASFLTSVPSDGIHQQLVLYFLLTNTSISISLILKLVLQGCHPWGCDQLGFYPWACAQLAFDMLLPSNKSLVTSPGKTDPEYFLCSCTQTLVSAWSQPCAVNMANCKQGWELLETGVVLSFTLSEAYFFPVKSRTRVKRNHSAALTLQ